MLQYDFEESIGYWLTITTQAYQRALNEELLPHGLTVRHLQVLGWLALEGDLTQSEMACRLMIEPPSLVGILDRMERAGWINRVASADDRRKKYIRLRPEAEPVWNRSVECARRLRERATATLSEDEQRLLKDCLRRVHNQLQETSSLGKPSGNSA